MSVVGTVKKSRPIQIVILICIIIITYFQVFSSSSEAYTPEEINSLLQNKDESTVSIKKVELTNQGLKAPYLDPSTLKPKNWDISGNTLVKNNEHIRLTSDNQHQVGNVFNKFPIQAESFEMELTFHLHSKSANSLVGDGFAIWLLDQRSEIGDVFGGQNYFNGLGIMVDTYKNGKRGHFPFVNLMLGDGKSAYNKESDGFETRLAGCTAKSLLNPSSEITKARIIYIKDGYLSLDFNYNGPDGDWHNCVTLTDIKLPIVKYLGFTAETGDLSENVDIIENKVFALYQPDNEESFIESIDQLETFIKEQAEMDKQIVDNIKKGKKTGGGKHRGIKRKSSGERRKSLNRLKKSEKRIKERERELRLAKYGDAEATVFSRLIQKFFKFLKIVGILTLLIIGSWFGYTILRVQRQKQKQRTTGLLD